MAHFLFDEFFSSTSEKNTLIHSTRIGHLIHKMILTNPTLLIESTLANSSENPSEKKLKTKCFAFHFFFGPFLFLDWRIFFVKISIKHKTNYYKNFFDVTFKLLPRLFFLYAVYLTLRGLLPAKNTIHSMR